jgi:hypothetical protein
MKERQPHHPDRLRSGCGGTHPGPPGVPGGGPIGGIGQPGPPGYGAGCGGTHPGPPSVPGGGLDGNDMGSTPSRIAYSARRVRRTLVPTCRRSRNWPRARSPCPSATPSGSTRSLAVLTAGTTSGMDQKRSEEGVGGPYAQSPACAGCRRRSLPVRPTCRVHGERRLD